MMIFEMTLNYNVILPMTLHSTLRMSPPDALPGEHLHLQADAARPSHAQALETNAYYFQRAGT